MLVTVSGSVTAQNGFSATSTTTNGINLSSNITEGIRITSSAAIVNAVTLGCYGTGSPDSTPIQFGFANTAGDHAKLGFSYSAANSSSNYMNLQVGVSSFKMANSTTITSTLNTPLAVTGLVRGTNLTATSFTASRVASIDASKNLISTDEALLKIATSNTDYSLFGSSSPDGSTNTRIVVSGSSRAGAPGEITYVSTGAAGAHVWWTGGTTEKMRLTNNGSLIMTNSILGSVSRRGTGYLPADQSIPSGSAAISWTKTILGPFTNTATRWTNNTPYASVVNVSVIVPWEQIFSLFTQVYVDILVDGVTHVGLTRSIGDGNLVVTTSFSATFALPINSYFEIWAYNNGGVARNIKGNTEGSFNDVTQMSFFIVT